MKKLLNFLGSIMLVTSATLPVVACETITSENVIAHLDGVSDEMIEMDLNLNDIINGHVKINDDNELVNVVTQAELILKDVANDTYFYELNTDIARIMNIYKTNLQNIAYQAPDGTTSNAYTIFNDFLNKCDTNFQIKLNSGAQSMLSQYEEYKSQEARLFYDIYDWKNSTMLDKIVDDQNQINVINVKNAEIQEQLKGLSRQNEIIKSIIDIVEVSEGFASKVKNIFDKAFDKVEKNYSKALWHEHNWGLGFIPFAGIGFNIAFKDSMDNATDAMTLYVDTFKNDSDTEATQLMNQLMDSLNSTKENIDAIDPANNDLIDKIIGEAHFDPNAAAIISKGMHTLINKIIKNLGLFGGVLSEVLSVLGDAFNAYKLHTQFGDFDKSYDKDFLPNATANGDEINRDYNAILESKKTLMDLYESNDQKTNELVNEMKNNVGKLNDLNGDLNSITVIKNNIDKSFTNLVNTAMYSDYIYYWRANEMGSINQIRSDNLFKSYDNPIQEITDVNVKKNEIYNKIINLLPNGELKDQFENDFKISNTIEKEIINI